MQSKDTSKSDTEIQLPKAKTVIITNIYTVKSFLNALLFIH
jgi:hypothetical protein